ncbi:MAG TPA: hypothetical protein VH988_34865 [Thermoanaerobaculia bacterium]|jgi:hypothetical protein|nr:hypothetical protein [Thermoanaerobaculia bacterium]
MRKLMLIVTLALVAAVAGLSSPAPVVADTCVTYCSTDACGYTCCSRECCGKICVDLDCAPPPSCGN